MILDVEHKTVQVLEMISDLWRMHRTLDFIDYLADATGVRVERVLEFNSFCVEEMSSGNLVVGDLYGPSTRAWMFNDFGHVQIRSSEEKLLLNSGTFIADGVEFFRVPHVRFFLHRDVLIIGELFGPYLGVRKICATTFNDDRLQILKTKIAWSYPDFDK